MSATASTYRELTFAAVILGVIQGAVMTAAFVYIGLKLGFGLSGSTVAAILGFALLRGVGRNALGVKGCGSIVENNINQTIASGINTASSGVTFTFPALLLLGSDYDLKTVILAAVAGSFMGIVVIVPLRKQMLEIERLKFPSGIAVATILKSPPAPLAAFKPETKAPNAAESIESTSVISTTRRCWPRSIPPRMSTAFMSSTQGGSRSEKRRWCRARRPTPRPLPRGISRITRWRQPHRAAEDGDTSEPV